jgi:hypothetical protein
MPRLCPAGAGRGDVKAHARRGQRAGTSPASTASSAWLGENELERYNATSDPEARYEGYW